MVYALLISVFVIASCGLVYELIAGTLASYLLGDSVMYFSTVIGTYLFAMGVGSYLSRFIGRALVARFVLIEIMVGLIGGSSAAVLFLSFAYLEGFRLILYGQVLLVGILVGLEIPLLLRILKDKVEFKDLVSQVLTFDYLGALIASLVFPLLLAPKLGLVRTCFMFGLLNALVAIWATYVFGQQLAARAASLRVQALVATAVLLAGFVYGDRMTTLAEEGLYTDDIIFARSTPYQRIVLTRWRDDLRLYLNGHLQFSSRDEYRYHEALVHPGLQFVHNPRRVLVLGGGDGLALREVLKYPSVESVTLVDLDEEMTRLFTTNPLLRELNRDSFHSARVRVVNADAFVWLNESKEFFDFAVADFPDPTNYALGKLYTSAFYKALIAHLSDNGAATVQATSPMFARRSFWCIDATLRSAGFTTAPYHIYVPSFGEWGFVLGTRHPYIAPAAFPPELKFITPATAAGLFEFPPDMQRVEADVNRLNNQILVQYYESEWRQVSQ
jgi:spermidine synthase